MDVLMSSMIVPSCINSIDILWALWFVSEICFFQMFVEWSYFQDVFLLFHKAVLILWDTHTTNLLDHTYAVQWSQTRLIFWGKASAQTTGCFTLRFNLSFDVDARLIIPNTKGSKWHVSVPEQEQMFPTQFRAIAEFTALILSLRQRHRGSLFSDSCPLTLTLPPPGTWWAFSSEPTLAWAFSLKSSFTLSIFTRPPPT